MPIITPGMIAGHAALAGFTGTSPSSPLVTAVAVALAESGGRTDLKGDTSIQTSTWGPSVGLWQIRSLKAESGTGGLRDATILTNPTTNAKAAFKISDGGSDWSPWSVYTSGRYRFFLPVATAAAVSPARVGSEIGQDIGNSGLGQTVGDALSDPLGMGGFSDGLGVISERLQAAGAWLGDRQNWIRIAQVVAGVALIVAGTVAATRPLQKKIGQEIVGTVVPIGKIGKAVKKSA